MLQKHFGEKEQAALKTKAEKKLVVFMLCMQRCCGPVVALPIKRRRTMTIGEGMVVFFLRLGQTHSIKKAIASYLGTQ